MRFGGQMDYSLRLIFRKEVLKFTAIENIYLFKAMSGTIQQVTERGFISCIGKFVDIHDMKVSILKAVTYEA